MAALPSYHGPHPREHSDDASSWSKPTQQTERIRVREHTCTCMPVVYELCVAGGLYFVRRLESCRDRIKVAESDRNIWKEVEALWQAIRGPVPFG